MSVTFFSPFLSITKEGHTYFMQDDITADTANYVFEDRTEKFDDVAASSPDLIPCDYYPWENIKCIQIIATQWKI
jgi:hypothetical protein